ncbi:hypothetical protein [Maritimibacter dapengensis]|uniref:Tat (Twin-arginine translocation) pathway signal sequence n=1 Tax=Maritimibacter dapengensis TaxID=2836868 RepID=A0ABS6T457_9RHOB|nr:hypothetical protein [Maritimibacter dapengensis]MBV7380034.1 hypothetical protein [Maritimibacter dapengensis]
MKRRTFIASAAAASLAPALPAVPAPLGLPRKDSWELALHAMSVQDRAMHGLWLYSLDLANENESRGELTSANASMIRETTRATMRAHGTPDITHAQLMDWERRQAEERRTG